MAEKMLIVDGHNLLVRSIMAMSYRPGQEMLQTSTGVVTGPLVSFINMLSQQVRSIQPDYVIVCWDGGKSGYRTGLDPEYKSNRTSGSYGEESGPDSPFTLAKEFLSLAGIPWLQRSGVEADDLIAGFVRLAESRLIQSYILSNDKDFFQLVADGSVTQIRLGVPGESQVTEKTVFDKLGVGPDDVDAHMALTGDAGDNVKGVPGIGPKTAAKLLEKWNYHLESVLENESKVIPYADRVRTNLKLVGLLDVRPEDVGSNHLVPPPRFVPTNIASPLWEPLLGFLDRYEMRVVSHRLQADELWKDPWKPGLTRT